jgi:hypothetical protein
MPVIKGHFYSWPKILTNVPSEDSPPPFALHRDAVAVGFALNRWQNPKAPDEILVGYGDIRDAYADAYISNPTPVPVLIREREGDPWLCLGDFILSGWSDEVAEKNRRVRPFDIPAIYKILFMQEVPAAPQSPVLRNFSEGGSTNNPQPSR